MAGSAVALLRRERLVALTSEENERQTMTALMARVVGGYEKEDGGLAEPQTLVEIARELDVPSVALIRWLRASEARWGEYETALKLRADALVGECVGIADAVTDKEDVPAAKLQVDSRLKVAGRYDRERFGEHVSVEGGGVPPPDAGLVGFAAALLERIVDRRRTEREVAGSVVADDPQ